MKKITTILLIICFSTSIMNGDGSGAIVATINGWEGQRTAYDAIKAKAEMVKEKLKEAKKSYDNSWWAQNAHQVKNLLSMITRLGCLFDELDRFRGQREQRIGFNSCYYSLSTNVKTLNLKSNMVLLNSLMLSFLEDSNSQEKSTALAEASNSIDNTVETTNEEIKKNKEDIAYADARKSMNAERLRNFEMLYFASLNNSTITSFK